MPEEKSKYLTPELKAAADGLADFEAVDPREEQLKAIWPQVKEALAKGMTHKMLYDRLKHVVKGDKEMSFGSFTKLVAKLAARGKKKKVAAEKPAQPAQPKKLKAKPAAPDAGSTGSAAA